MSPDGTRLFVVDLDDAATYGGVTVVDTMTRKVVKVIHLETRRMELQSVLTIVRSM